MRQPLARCVWAVVIPLDQMLGITREATVSVIRSELVSRSMPFLSSAPDRIMGAGLPYLSET